MWSHTSNRALKVAERSRNFLWIAGFIALILRFTGSINGRMLIRIIVYLIFWGIPAVILLELIILLWDRRRPGAFIQWLSVSWDDVLINFSWVCILIAVPLCAYGFVRLRTLIKTAIWMILLGIPVIIILHPLINRLANKNYYAHKNNANTSDKVKISAMALAFTVIGVFALHTKLNTDNAQQIIQTTAQKETMNASVNTYALNLRSAPSSQADILTILYERDMVQIIDNTDHSNAWTKIRFKDFIGFVDSRYLDGH